MELPEIKSVQDIATLLTVITTSLGLLFGGIYKLIDKVINADFFINLVTSSPNEKTILHNALQAMQNILHTQNRSLFTTDNFYKSIC
mgnify:CR=1 FL=1